MPPQDPSPSSSSVLHTSLTTPPPLITSATGHYLHTPSHPTLILDATGGAAVSSIGHSHPKVLSALTHHLSSHSPQYLFAPWFTSQPYEDLSTFLTSSTGGRMSKVFVTGSGAEAVEAAIKLARQFFVEKEGVESKRWKVISREKSYHGNTLGALSVSGHAARRRVFEPMLGLGKGEGVGFVRNFYPYRVMRRGEREGGYVERLRTELIGEIERLGGDSVCAVVMETMAGLTLGAVPPGKGYLRMVREVCDSYGILLVLDEVLAGMGRTGTLHAWEQEGVVPDLQTVAKGLGAGYLPIGALLVSRKVVEVLERGSNGFAHFQTYHGHPVTCAAALAVQKVIKEEGLLENVKRVGPYLEKLLRERLGDHPNVGDIRGRGMIWAMELVKDKKTKEPFPVADKIAPTIHATGLKPEFGISLLPGGGVANGVDGDLILLAPPFTITHKDAELIIDRTARALEHVLGKTKTPAKL